MDVFHEILHHWFTFCGVLSNRKSSILSHECELKVNFSKHYATKPPQSVELRLHVLYALTVGYS